MHSLTPGTQPLAAVQLLDGRAAVVSPDHQSLVGRGGAETDHNGLGASVAGAARCE